MKLFKLAVEKQRWDLADHTIVLAAARILNKGDKPHARQSTPKSKRIKGKPEKACWNWDWMMSPIGWIRRENLNKHANPEISLALQR